MAQNHQAQIEAAGEKLVELIDEAQALDEKEELTEEESTRLTAVMDEKIPAQEKVIKDLKAKAKRAETLQAKKAALSKPEGPAPRPDASGAAPGVITGESGQQSRRYSFMRVAAAIASGDFSHAKLEVHISGCLRKEGYHAQDKGILVPFNGRYLAAQHESLAKEGLTDLLSLGRRELQAAQSNPAAMQFLSQQSIFDDTLGGALVQPTPNADLIDLLRPQSALTRLGVMIVDLPPSGRMPVAKLTQGAVFGYAKEGKTIQTTLMETETGWVNGKKVAGAILIPMESIKWQSPSWELIARRDMARGLALFWDQEGIEGVGAAEDHVLGIIHSGILTHAAATQDIDGDTFTAQDPEDMIGLVEEESAMFNGFIMRPLMYRKIRNRRADAVSADDEKGPFLFDTDRIRGGVGDRKFLSGYQVADTPKVSRKREKGASSDLTYVLGGDFNEFLLVIEPVVEFTADSSVRFFEDQLALKAIQYGDGFVRHPNAFIFTDTLKVQ